MIKILFTVILIGFVCGCSESFLEEFPRLSQSNELTLSTYDGLYKATAGAYDNLCSQNWYGASFIITADLKGGNAKRGPVNSGRYVNTYLWNNSASSTSNLWQDAYKTIASANNVINVIDGGFQESGIEQSELDVLKGEALFLRALAYWDLVRLYSLPYSAGTGNLGVPVVTVTENGYPARNTVGDVYTQIVADLGIAESLLPSVVTHRDNGSGMAWASRWAAKALLAKVYLYMENWDDAAAKAGEVIANTDFSLFTAADYTTWDLGGYWGSGPGGSEIIFQVDVSETNNTHPWWEALPYLLDPYGYGDIATSVDLLNLYEAGDVRADLFQVPPEFPSFSWSTKYPGRLGGSPKRECNTPVFRLSDMYLIRAEAVLEGASGNALADYNAIRTKRGLAAAATVNLTDIYAERRRELCFEGNELFDLSRTGRSLFRTDAVVSINKDVPFIVGGSALDNYLWAMPIPQIETDSNVNVEQNPGY